MTQTTERAHADLEGAVARTEDRSPAAIEAEIERTRAQLAGTIDEIADRVNPKHVAQRGAARLKRRPVIPAATVAGAVALIAVAVWRRRRG